VNERVTDRTGMLCAFLSVFCWGSALVVTKATLADFAPLSLLVLQLASSVVCLWFFVWLRPTTSVRWNDITKFAWLGVLEPGLAYLLSFFGLADTEAGGAALIFSLESILIVVVSAVLFRERPRGRFIVLSILALGGLLIALDLLNLQETLGRGSVGKLLIFGGTAIAAVYVVLSKRVATHADPIYIVAWQQSIALIFVLIVLAAGWAIHPRPQALPSAIGIWLLVAVTGVVQYALSFSLYMKALRTITANMAGSFLILIPLFGLAGGFLFLHEKLSAFQLMGAALTIGAVTLLNLKGDHASD